MIQCNINRVLISSLANKSNDILNDIIGAENNGYLVDECEYSRVGILSMLKHAVEQEYILTHKQKHNLNQVVNKALRT